MGRHQPTTRPASARSTNRPNGKRAQGNFARPQRPSRVNEAWRDMGKTRVAVRPINKRAAANASKRFYKNHPEMVGSTGRIALDVCNRAHDRLRTEWMDLYVKFGGKVRQSGLTYYCSSKNSSEPDLAEVMPFISVKGDVGGAGWKLELWLESNHGVVTAEVHRETEVSTRWELPRVGQEYQVGVRLHLAENLTMPGRRIVQKLDQELAKVNNEYNVWLKEYKYKEPKWVTVLKGLGGLANDPGEAQAEGHLAQENSDSKDRYLARVQALGAYRVELEKMKATLLDAIEPQTKKISVFARVGQVQILTIEFEAKVNLPDHKALLKRSPRVWKKE